MPSTPRPVSTGSAHPCSDTQQEATEGRPRRPDAKHTVRQGRITLLCSQATTATKTPTGTCNGHTPMLTAAAGCPQAPTRTPGGTCSRYQGILTASTEGWTSMGTARDLAAPAGTQGAAPHSSASPPSRSPCPSASCSAGRDPGLAASLRPDLAGERRTPDPAEGRSQPAAGRRQRSRGRSRPRSPRSGGAAALTVASPLPARRVPLPVPSASPAALGEGLAPRHDKSPRPAAPDPFIRTPTLKPGRQEQDHSSSRHTAAALNLLGYQRQRNRCRTGLGAGSPPASFPKGRKLALQTAYIQHCYLSGWTEIEKNWILNIAEKQHGLEQSKYQNVPSSPMLQTSG
ncbi:cadherin-related family member 5-like [Grus americana]|uniref:cadherin-related family member 5-like n=1 Tax=Grus americana TaxID=9117 RepID=UPI0024081703|nr:cadherin-related family member 5-like [Grus americana]